MAHTADTNDRQTTPWWNGLPLAGRRDLTQEERLAMMARACRDGKRGGVTAGIGLFALAVPFLFVLFTGSLAETTGAWGVTIVFLVGASLLARARPALKRAVALAHGARLGYVERYMQPAPVRPAGNGVGGAREPLTAAGTPATPAHAGIVEVVAESDLVWQVDGAAPADWIFGPRVDLADVPPHAGIAAGSLQPAADPGGRVVYHGERVLSDAEKDEVAVHRKREISAWRWWVTFGSGVLASGACENVGYDIAGLVLWILVWFVLARAAWLVLPGLRQIRRLADDARVGRVVLLRIPTRGEHASGDAMLPPVLEYLSASGRLWSCGGKPAAWRVFPLE